MIQDRISSLLHDRRWSNLIERACRHWEARRQAIAQQRDITPETAQTFTIALSREAGTQGTLIANEVGQRLCWHVYDHELLEQIAREMGLRTALLESVDERQQSWMHQSIEASLATLMTGESAPWAIESAYVHHLVETVHALGVHGECVIVGRGAGFILPPERTLRVHLVGSLRDRIAVVAGHRGLSEHDAANLVRTLDHERNEFVAKHFFRNPNDPSNYDVVLNVPRLTVKHAADLIIEALHRM